MGSLHGHQFVINKKLFFAFVVFYWAFRSFRKNKKAPGHLSVPLSPIVDDDAHPKMLTLLSMFSSPSCCHPQRRIPTPLDPCAATFYIYHHHHHHYTSSLCHFAVTDPCLSLLPPLLLYPNVCFLPHQSLLRQVSAMTVGLVQVDWTASIVVALLLLIVGIICRL